MASIVFKSSHLINSSTIDLFNTSPINSHSSRAASRLCRPDLHNHKRASGSCKPCAAPRQTRRRKARKIAEFESCIARNISLDTGPPSISASAESEGWPAHFLIALETRTELRETSSPPRRRQAYWRVAVIRCLLLAGLRCACVSRLL